MLLLPHRSVTQFQFQLADGYCLFGDRNQHAQPSQSHTDYLLGAVWVLADIRVVGLYGCPVDDSLEIRAR